LEVPKLNKPRSAPFPHEKTARELLSLHQIDPSEVREVQHFSDGSMSVISGRGADLWHTGFEFDSALTAELALAFRALGIRVDRSAG
jgi:hypothetical protein